MRLLLIVSAILTSFGCGAETETFSKSLRCSLAVRSMVEGDLQTQKLLSSIEKIELLPPVKIALPNHLAQVAEQHIFQRWTGIYSRKKLKKALREALNLAAEAEKMSNKKLLEWRTKRSLPKESEKLFKELKDSGNEVRNLFLIYDNRHTIPPPLQSFIKQIGALKDRTKVDTNDISTKRKRRIWRQIGQISAKIREKLNEEDSGNLANYGFTPATNRDVAKFLEHHLAGLDRLVRKENFTRHDYHAIKKSLRVLHTFFKTLRPHPPTENTLFIRETIKVLVKALNVNTENFAQDKIVDKITLKDTLFPLRPEVAELLTLLGQRLSFH